jgi:S-adenosylmethionine-dependent methyltransferase
MPEPRTPLEQRRKIEEVAMQVYCNWIPPELRATDRGQFMIGQHVWQRYEQALYDLAPWVHRAGDLTGRRVVEIGSGTGSSTAGFASRVARIDGYEITGGSVALARARLDILGIHNAEVHLVEAQSLMATVCERHRGKVDAFLLYAVLEHMTIEERIQCLRSAWSELPSGGLLIVIETPNRLTYTDLHTAQMPFFHMLPGKLAALYYEYSPRSDFVKTLAEVPPNERPMALVRWGNGVSFHEFDVAIGPGVDSFIVADGFEDEVTRIYPIRIDDELLLRYFEAQQVGRHRAFTRNHLNFVLRKP